MLAHLYHPEQVVPISLCLCSLPSASRAFWGNKYPKNCEVLSHHGSRNHRSAESTGCDDALPQGAPPRTPADRGSPSTSLIFHLPVANTGWGNGVFPTRTRRDKGRAAAGEPTASGHGAGPSWLGDTAAHRMRTERHKPGLGLGRSQHGRATLKLTGGIVCGRGTPAACTWHGKGTLQPPASIRGETLPATRDKAARAQRCSPQRGSLKVAFRAYNIHAVPSSALGAARDGMSDRMDHQLAPNGNTHRPGAIIIGAERFRPC